MRFFQKGVNALLIWPIRAEKAIDKLFGKHLLTERDKENINIKELKSGSRRGTISKISSNLAISLVEEYGISFAEKARQLGVSTSAVSKIIRRTENRKLT